MFEKLTRLRAELERITPRYEEITAKYEDIKAKIREEEVTQIIGVVDKVNMTPEQLAEYLGVREEKKPAPSKNKKSAQGKKTAETKTADEYAESSAGSDDQNTTNVGMEDILNESY
ncbi:DUF4315 family protein [Butyrivibrio sp. AC2005]|uniref:DUF4315 family protein n=1 Tax=Butyrivibrio sp. AC2005 TaxID=1280672 RepID=UPI000411F341|nr:DUF4315 family protein [Butyrivibrio sp. AC2005]